MNVAEPTNLGCIDPVWPNCVISRVRPVGQVVKTWGGNLACRCRWLSLAATRDESPVDWNILARYVAISVVDLKPSFSAQELSCF